jgi:putative ATP-binding cassette transporter
LEDRPIYLFDEWAANQDPIFRTVFYSQILPDLKARGKTVIVITHDDHYFAVADRLIKLDYGQIQSDSAVQGSPAALALNAANAQNARPGTTARPLPTAPTKGTL